MIQLLVDTSVVVKWFHTEGETEVEEARAIRDAHQRDDLNAHILDLALYELGNVLTRTLGWAPADVADQLDDVLAICGPPLAMAAECLRSAAMLASEHDLTFYDASWAAAARILQIALVSANTRLLAAGLAESPAAVASRLRLRRLPSESQPANRPAPDDAE